AGESAAWRGLAKPRAAGSAHPKRPSVVAARTGIRYANDLPEPVGVQMAACRPANASSAKSAWCCHGLSIPAARMPSLAAAGSQSGHCPVAPPVASRRRDETTSSRSSSQFQSTDQLCQSPPTGPSWGETGGMEATELTQLADDAVRLATRWRERAAAGETERERATGARLADLLRDPSGL